MIGIVDYNMGNLASVKNAFASLGENIILESNPANLAKYDKLILPGVGAFGDAMQHLREQDMIEPLLEYAKSGKYMMGICLGMQLLFDSSQEFGFHEGLGLIRGTVTKFDKEKLDENLKIPHMGWNKMFMKTHPLFKDMQPESYLYFVHSYHANCADSNDSIATTHYGYEFTSAVAHANILGIQPHPEKSHNNGLKILKNFIDL